MSQFRHREAADRTGDEAAPTAAMMMDDAVAPPVVCRGARQLWAARFVDPGARNRLVPST